MQEITLKGLLSTVNRTQIIICLFFKGGGSFQQDLMAS